MNQIRGTAKLHYTPRRRIVLVYGHEANGQRDCCSTELLPLRLLWPLLYSRVVAGMMVRRRENFAPEWNRHLDEKKNNK